MYRFCIAGLSLLMLTVIAVGCADSGSTADASDLNTVSLNVTGMT